MSISSTTRRNNYTGNGATDTYSYSFKIFADTDLLVTKNVSGTETTLILDTDYTVTGVGSSSGGTIVLVGGDLDSGVLLTIRRVRPLTQSTDIRNQGDFYPEVHEDSFDNAAMVSQQQQDEIDRSVKTPETIDSTSFDPTLPASIAGSISTVIGTNATGDGFEIGPTFTEISNAQTYALSAAASAIDALNSANAADVSADDATASAAAALASEGVVAASALAAATSESNASASEIAAAASELNAGNSAGAASASAILAAASEGNASTYASNALTSANNAATSESNALTYKNNAQTSATNAGTSETNAAASAAAAAATSAAIYNAIVGAGVGCNYATLTLALAAASAGWRILIKDSETVNTGGAFTLSLANLLIEFAPSVTFTKGTLVGSCFTIDASGCRIKGGRFSGFDTAVTINSTRQYNFITECRFASCTAEVTESDASPVNVISMNITE